MEEKRVVRTRLKPLRQYQEPIKQRNWMRLLRKIPAIWPLLLRAWELIQVIFESDFALSDNV
jgi:hypothetical protein